MGAKLRSKTQKSEQYNLLAVTACKFEQALHKRKTKQQSHLSLSHKFIIVYILQEYQNFKAESKFEKQSSVLKLLDFKFILQEKTPILIGNKKL